MNVLKSILDAIFPPTFTCDICGEEVFDGGHFCKSCLKTVEFNSGTTCILCGRKTQVNALCLECKASTPVYDGGVSALVYGGGARKLIIRFKNGHAYLKDYFAELLYYKCRKLHADAVCYVPMTKASERRRGYNQSYLLAKGLSQRLNLPLLKGAVEKVNKTKSQKTLSKSERLENLKSTFKADRTAVEGKNLIVVDDVLTTGATADAISWELKKRGAKKVYIATVASVEYKEKTLDGKEDKQG